MIDNETTRLLASRTSVRAFQDKGIDEEIVEQLKTLTQRAPSAGNMQYWSVIEATDPDRRKTLAHLWDNQEMIAKAPLVWIFLADLEKWYDHFRLSGCQGLTDRSAAYGWGNTHLALQDALIAAQNAVVAAQALGLGSCYVGDCIENTEQMTELLKLPRHAIIATALIFGWPKGQNGPRNLSPRCPNDFIFMKDTYQKRTFEELEEANKEKEDLLRRSGRLKALGADNIAQYYYLRKHTSAFMAEMNRSAGIFMKACAEEPQ